MCLNFFSSFFFLFFDQFQFRLGFSSLGLIIFYASKRTPLSCSHINEASNVDVLTRIADLRQAYTYFFRRGFAAERFFANATAFEDIVAAATHVPSAIV